MHEICTYFLIATARLPTWPDGYDGVITVLYLVVILTLPLLGYVVMVLDIRRYLRSLRRALVTVSQILPGTPAWALRRQPACLKIFDLELPCTELEVLAAYRTRAKEMHPDRGGDLQEFLRLQRQFELALEVVKAQEST